MSQVCKLLCHISDKVKCVMSEYIKYIIQDVSYMTCLIYSFITFYISHCYSLLNNSLKCYSLNVTCWFSTNLKYLKSKCNGISEKMKWVLHCNIAFDNNWKCIRLKCHMFTYCELQMTLCLI